MRRVKQLALLTLSEIALFGFVHADSITGLSYYSSPSSWVGGGESATILPGDGFLFTATRNYDQGVSFSINNFATAPTPQDYRWWNLDMAGQNNAPLAVGTYAGATRFPFQEAANPGFNFSGNGRGNNTLSGEFTVIEVSYATDGTILTFAANFIQYDETQVDKWTSGSIRYNSTLAIGSVPPATTTLTTETELVASEAITYGNLSKTGSGKVILTGINTYGGKTYVSAGTLQVGDGTAMGTLGSGDVVVSSGATLAFARPDIVDVTNAISGSGTIVQNGTETLRLKNLTGFTGALRAESGLMVINTDHLAATSISIGADAIVAIEGSTTAYANAPVTGTGGLIYFGSSTLGLENTSGFTGSLAVTSGTLVLNPFGLKAAAAKIHEGATLVLTGYSSVNTVDSALSGAGTIQFASTGTTLLSDSAGFTGQFNVTGGTLSLDSAKLNAHGVNIASGTNVNLGSSNDGARTVNSALAGSGRLTVYGTGTTLSDASGFTGEYRVMSSRLSIAAPQYKATHAVVMQDTSLELSGDYAGKTLTGDFAGAGTVLFTGTGKLIMKHAALAIAADAVASTNAGDTGPGSAATTVSGSYSGGTLVLKHDNTLSSNVVTTTGVLRFSSGSTSFPQLGEGTLTLTNPETSSTHYAALMAAPIVIPTEFTGLLQVDSGHIVIGVDDLAKGRIQVNSAGTVELYGFSGTASALSVISGDGKILFTGIGGADFTDVGTIDTGLDFAGTQVVDFGTDPTAIRVAGDVSIGALATLRGQGRIQGNLTNAGTLAPGNSPGIITIGGDFTNTGTLDIEIAGNGAPGAADGSDQIRYSGQANLGGTLNIIHLSGYTPTGVRTVRFLEDTAPGATPEVNGAFATVNLPTGTVGVLRVSSDGVDLVYAGQSTLVAHDGLAPFVQTLANTAAQSALGSLLDTFVASGDAAGAAATTNASPIAFGSLTTLSLSEAQQTADFLRSRAFSRTAVTPGSEWGAYATVTGEFATAEDNTSAATFDRNTYGGKAGLENTVATGLTLGVNAGYDNGRADIRNGGGRVTQDHLSVAAYADYALTENTLTQLAAFGGYSLYETKRTTVGGQSTGDSEGFDGGVAGVVGYRVDASWLPTFTPFAGLVYSHAEVDGFTETGGAFAYRVGAYDQDSLRTKLGVNLENLLPVASWLRVGLGFTWEHELLDTTVDIPASFVTGPAGNFKTASATLPGDVIVVSPNVAFTLAENSTLSLGYDLRYGFDDEIAHRVNLTFTQRF